jgi:hypothetical protein
MLVLASKKGRLLQVENVLTLRTLAENGSNQGSESQFRRPKIKQTAEEKFASDQTDGSARRNCFDPAQHAELKQRISLPYKDVRR